MYATVELEGGKLYGERAILVITSAPRGNLNCCEPNMQNFRPFSYSGQSGSPIPFYTSLPLSPSRFAPGTRTVVIVILFTGDCSF